MLLYLLIAVLCVVGFHAYVRYGRYGKLINKLPGPTPLPILGNLLLLNKGPVDLWNFLHVKMKEYYPFGKIWFCTSAIILTQDPDDLKILLSDKVNIVKGFMYKPLHLWAETGLITGTGEKWQHRRKIITPAFHANIIKKYIEITSEQGERFVEYLKTKGDETVESLIPICSNLTLSIIIEAAMGTKFNTMGDKAEEYKKAIEDYFHGVAYRATRPYIQNWMLRYFGRGRRILDCIKSLRGFADKIIEERREYHNQTKHQSFQNYVDDVDDTNLLDGGRKKRLAMLDLLLLAEKEGLIDEQGIKEEVDTFTAAGYDTTGMGMVYMLLLLAENKDVQKLARAESDRILSASGGRITMTEIQQMDYIERCVKESLRLFPTAPNISRTIIKDIQLKNCMVPAGTDVFVPIYDVHRDPKYWPDPLKFDPDRFLPEEVHKRHPFSYLPFSHGPRNCIGQKFAIAEMKALVARIVYNFYLEPVTYTKDLQFTAHIVLLSTVPPCTKFIKRLRSKD
ncbi:cytochrome P450 4AB15 [Nasonia vitripennis]|uniref:Cytochrome P450 n=2 Tax=Nasonia vitripennis TaxID=7425 RepID=A0A7M6W8G3_NASVI|nr:cytochrome P450 4AB15 [Nasonia vitripennis]